MSRLSAWGFALVVVVQAGVQAGAANADPATQQLSPIHQRREDVLRLRDQQRALDAGRSPTASLPVTTGDRTAAAPAKAAAGISVLAVVAFLAPLRVGAGGVTDGSRAAPRSGARAR